MVTLHIRNHLTSVSQLVVVFEDVRGLCKTMDFHMPHVIKTAELAPKVFFQIPSFWHSLTSLSKQLFCWTLNLLRDHWRIHHVDYWWQCHPLWGHSRHPGLFGTLKRCAVGRFWSSDRFCPERRQNLVLASTAGWIRTAWIFISRRYNSFLFLICD